MLIIFFSIFYRGVHCSDTVGGAVCGPCPQGKDDFWALMKT